MKPVKNKKIIHRITKIKAGQRKLKTAGLALMLRGQHEILLRAACLSLLI